jgi:hypothetical protein
MKRDPYVGRKKEVRILRADVCGGVADLNIKGRCQKVETTIERSMFTEEETIILDTKR